MPTYRNALVRTCAHVTLLVGSVMVLASCQPQQREANGEIVATGRPIINGTADTDPAHMAVVALTPGPNWSSFCTGTLVTPTVVVTAAHCLENRSTSDTQVFFGNNVFGSGEYRQVSEMRIHQNYNSQTVEYDIAIMRLSSPAPSGVTPIPALPASIGLTAADQGSTVTFSGFGVTETNSSGVKLRVDGPIGVVCPGPNGCSYSNAWVVARAMGYPNNPGGPAAGTRAVRPFCSAAARSTWWA